MLSELHEIDDLLLPAGLILRGAFHPEPTDDVPVTGKTVALVGNAGPAMWSAFAAERADEPNPLDSWTRRTLDPIAHEVDATVLYPFDGPPYLPFQSWAQRADDVFPSPIGPLIHPIYGLWHAYRGALVFTNRLPLSPRGGGGSPCEGCEDRPCLDQCPASALTDGGYDVPACIEHIESEPEGECRQQACLARSACPIGQHYHYGAEQGSFHMSAFLRGLHT